MKLLLDTHTWLLHHRDPFDRLLAAQAICEEATLVTADAKMALYPINLIQ
jgi:PIN domain nuclease of toxin-antitoxin system